jgi:hypothetical protein
VAAGPRRRRARGAQLYSFDDLHELPGPKAGVAALRGEVAVDVRGAQLRQPPRLHGLLEPLRAQHTLAMSVVPHSLFLTSVKNWVQKASILCWAVVSRPDMG